jgi:hypothetical protein
LPCLCSNPPGEKKKDAPQDAASQQSRAAPPALAAAAAAVPQRGAMIDRGKRLLAIVFLCVTAISSDGAFGQQEGKFTKIRLQLPATKESGKKSKQRVAIIMAGSARSFIFPMIHWSIKTNVIDALNAETVDIFVRVSTQDNIHGHGIKSANGVTFNLTSQFQGWLDEALKVIKPLKVEFTTLDGEPAEIERVFPTTPWPHANYHHSIFRAYDKRRYSMFFNRHMGYSMALDYANENGFEYDWFMNLRFDTGWASPMEPM